MQNEEESDNQTEAIYEIIEGKVDAIHSCIVSIVERMGFQYQSLSNRVSQYMIVIGFVLMLLIVAFSCLVYFNLESRELQIDIYRRLNELEQHEGHVLR